MSTRSTPPTLRRAGSAVGHGVGRRVRLFAVALTAVAALALTGCHDGQGLRDEGPSGAGALTGGGALTGTGADAEGGYGDGDAPARSHAEPPSGNS